MKLIAGLGNPGSRYSQTRHNAGRLVIESLAEQSHVPFKSQKKLQASIAQITVEAQSVLLAYPETYMNVSGEPIQKLVEYYKIDAARDLLIVVDDVALPFLKLRLRGKGTSGGHNGLKSIAQFLGTDVYARLRLGVGPAADETINIPLEEYVLGKFSSEEEKSLRELLRRGAEACLLWALEPLSKVMTLVNA